MGQDISQDSINTMLQSIKGSMVRLEEELSGMAETLEHLLQVQSGEIV